jgi:hypothetical protein
MLLSDRFNALPGEIEKRPEIIEILSKNEDMAIRRMS